MLASNLFPEAVESPYLNRQFKLEYSTQKQSKQTRTFLFCLDLIWKKGLHNVQWPVFNWKITVDICY